MHLRLPTFRQTNLLKIQRVRLHAWLNTLQADIDFFTRNKDPLPTFEASAGSSQTSQVCTRNVQYSAVRMNPYHTRREREKREKHSNRRNIMSILPPPLWHLRMIRLRQCNTILHSIRPPAYRPNSPIMSQGIRMTKRDVRREGTSMPSKDLSRMQLIRKTSKWDIWAQFSPG